MNRPKPTECLPLIRAHAHRGLGSTVYVRVYLSTRARARAGVEGGLEPAHRGSGRARTAARAMRAPRLGPAVHVGVIECMRARVPARPRAGPPRAGAPARSGPASRREGRRMGKAAEWGSGLAGGREGRLVGQWRGWVGDI